METRSLLSRENNNDGKKIIKKITKINPKFYSGTLCSIYKKIAPCLEFGLVNKTMHRVDECVSLSDLKNLPYLSKYFRRIF